MTKQEQDTARARCEAATPGPWEFVDGDNVICSPGIADVCFIPSMVRYRMSVVKFYAAVNLLSRHICICFGGCHGHNRR